MSSLSVSTIVALHRSMSSDKYGEPAEERGLKPDFGIKLVIKQDGKESKMGAALLCGRTEDTTGTLQR